MFPIDTSVVIDVTFLQKNEEKKAAAETTERAAKGASSK